MAWSEESGQVQPTHGIDKSGSEMDELEDEIEKNGFDHFPEPIAFVVSGNVRYIVDGHHRVRAAQNLGLRGVPAIEVTLPYKGYKTE